MIVTKERFDEEILVRWDGEDPDCYVSINGAKHDIVAYNAECGCHFALKTTRLRDQTVVYEVFPTRGY